MLAREQHLEHQRDAVALDERVARERGIALAVGQVLERLEVERLILQPVIELVREHHLGHCWSPPADALIVSFFVSGS